MPGAVNTEGTRVQAAAGARAGLPPSLPAGIPAGVLATATMDAALVVAAVLGGRALDSPRLGAGMIGRWMAGLVRGRWRSDDVSSEPPQPGELALGLLTHYGTGVALTQAYLLLPRRDGGGPGFTGGLAFGMATAVLPLLVMFPSMGYGVAGTRTGEAGRLNRIMLVGHVGFGIGIGLFAPLLARRRCPCAGPARTASPG